MNHDARNSAQSNRRLQIILLLMIAWDVLALLAELSFGGPLFKIEGTGIGGILAAKGSLGGAAAVPIVLYLYALIRGPMRHRGVLWAGVVEHGAATLACVFHFAAGDLELGGIVFTLGVSIAFVVLLLLSMPRSQPVAGS